jgi:hypothetical protein
VSHHGLPWDADILSNGPRIPEHRAAGRHATQEIPVLPVLARDRWRWLAPTLVFATSAIVVTGVVGFMWLWLGDGHAPLLASLGLAVGIHATVSAEIFVLSRLPDPETAGHCCGTTWNDHNERDHCAH